MIKTKIKKIKTMKKTLLTLLFSSLLIVSTSANKYNKSKYLKLLKTAGEYTFEESEFAGFTYQSASDSNLQLLRTTFNLDSVAGIGTEIEKAKNLMSWVHNQVKHNGNKGIPKSRNAKDMLEVCHKENRTLNCRGLAIVLNEVYLSMGYKSRYVTCMPKDSTDTDCHVINTVFIKSLNKWVWMDPTFETYVTDENDNLLGIQEVRNRLINDKPLKINDDANWNNRSKLKIKYYLYQYMAKNLYRLECAVSSEYNFETYKKDKQIKFVQLIPVDYMLYKKGVKENNHGINGRIDRTYISNPNIFWKKP